MWVRLEGKLYNLDRITKIYINGNGLYLDDTQVIRADLSTLITLLGNLNELLGVRLTAHSVDAVKDKVQMF